LCLILASTKILLVTSPLAVIAEPQRQRILQLVWNAEKSAGEIASEFEITFGAVSQHLRVLRMAGFVSVTKRGRHRYYRANRNALGSLAEHLEAMWRSGDAIVRDSLGSA
jgi:DNA-binding transcriptional ArsR family regulator